MPRLPALIALACLAACHHATDAPSPPANAAALEANIEAEANALEAQADAAADANAADAMANTAPAPANAAQP